MTPVLGNPGGESGMLYDEKGCIGFTLDGKTLKPPSTYTPREREDLRAIVRRTGVRRKDLREYYAEILNAAADPQ